MDDEPPLDQDIPENKPEDLDKWQLAATVLKAAVREAGAHDISEYQGESLNLRWHLFFQEFPNDVVLKMLVQGLFGTIHADVSLITAARWVLDEVEGVLNRPDANRLLDISEVDRPEVLRENAKMILTGLVNRIPLVAFHALSEALRESVEFHVKTHIEPRLKAHWQSLGLPKDYTVTPSLELTAALQGVDEQFKILRKQLSGNKRARLTDERRINLVSEHEELRIAYDVAKGHYNQMRKAFFFGKRNRTLNEWEEEWAISGPRIFPDLFYRCLHEINSYQPFELAHMHLADFYGYSPQYMAKLVSQSSSLKPKTSE